MLIVIFVLMVVMGIMTALSKSEKYRNFFTNTGIETFRDIKYATIGGNKGFLGRAEDDEFLADDKSGDQDMTAYTMPAQPQTDMFTYADEDIAPRGVETAAASVPRLQAPPLG